MTMMLDVRAWVPSIDEATLADLAAKAASTCPVSGALRGNVDIQLRTRLES